MAAIKLTRSHRILVGIVLAGAVVIATIGFVGSYAAVRELAERKGFGQFAPFFPIGIDAGIVVLLALDLLLTWLRIPFPLLRQTAWLLTAATIAFNGAVSWPDPLGVGMHAIIPVLFIITVEAARHAIGRIADITADRHMEGVRFWRWFLSPVPTFRLWRRMKLWELRSYEEVINLERDRLVYQAQLRARYGRAWRRRAPVEARMPLKLARYGVPLSETAPAGTAAAAAGRRAPAPQPRHELTDHTPGPAERPTEPAAPQPDPHPGEHTTGHDAAPGHDTVPRQAGAHDGPPPHTAGPRPRPAPEPAPRPAEEHQPLPVYAAGPRAGRKEVTVPVVHGGRRRSLGNAPAEAAPLPAPAPEPAPPAPEEPLPAVEPRGLPRDTPHGDAFYAAYREYVLEQGDFPNARQLSRFLHERHGVTDADGSLLTESYLRDYLRECRMRYRAEMGTAG
ncbi:DUF2637 domain-containing protein [Streptomyces sodiiphilus]|uniref:DUF2637 domain-containing protein n=1 Tax=Streptomyces sodiiphilus TaxID=226217 RepID=A0ABN2PUM1_9ACTN